MKTITTPGITALAILGIAKGAADQPGTAKEEAQARSVLKVDMQKAAATKPGKASAKALVDPMVKQFFAVNPDYNRESKFIVSEYEIEGLWDTLGVQLFLLNCGPGHRREVFACANGTLTFLKLDSFASMGVEEAAISHGYLYFTHSAGSGIGRTPLVKLGLGQDQALTYAVLGSIKSYPDDEEDQIPAKKMKHVITRLRPVKQGAATEPAAAPKPEKKREAPDVLKDEAASAKEGASRVQPQQVDLEQSKDKVIVRFGADTVATLRREGDRLLPRAPGEKAEATDVVVKITLKETTATPFPVKGDPTRSYLEMSHGSDKWLHFRALARLKGSKEFHEMPGPLEPAEPGDLSLVRCWESGMLMEEVMFYEFKLMPEAAGTTDQPRVTPGNKPPSETTHSLNGTRADRIATITKQLSRAGKLPGPLLDAHFVEEQTGDGILGPSDFAAFYALTVSHADLPAWRAELSKAAGGWNRFSNDPEIKRAAPKQVPPWWVNPADSSKLEIYSPKSLTGRSNGWIGIAPDGRIFIYAFTM